jgi:hypothetical protein
MRVLLLDTAFAAAPLYDALTAQGHDVWTVGNRPADVLAKKAGIRWIYEDYSKQKEIAAHARRLSIERAVPGCTDVSMETHVALALAPLLTDSLYVNRCLTNKAEFRALCVALDLAAPKVLSPRDFPMQGRFICKPVDGFSGRGITIFDGNDNEAIASAWATAIAESPSATALIETCVSGDLYSCSAFIEGHRVRSAFYVREGASCHPFAVDTSYIVSDFPSDAARILEEALRKISVALGLRAGLLHIQFILEDGQPFIIEAARRCPGDLYGLLVEYSSGFPYAAEYASYFLGLRSARPIMQRRFVLRHTVASVSGVIYGGLRLGIPLVVRAFIPLQVTGQELTARQGTRAGVLFCEFESYHQLQCAYDEFLARRVYELS